MVTFWKILKNTYAMGLLESVVVVIAIFKF